jgi:hypothetical protein
MRSQGSVPRSDLIAAIAELNAAKEEAESRARDVAALDQQLVRIKEQRQKEKTAMGEMVSRSELAASIEREEELTALAREAAEKQREIASKLEKKIGSMEVEMEQLRATIQVMERRNAEQMFEFALKRSISGGMLNFSMPVSVYFCLLTCLETLQGMVPRSELEGSR